MSSRLSKFVLPLPPISSLKLNENKSQIGPVLPPDHANLDNEEPNANDENSLLIAIRLPDGCTFKRHFLKTDLIANIIKYASKQSNIDFANKNVNLLEMPKNVINDFSRTIEFYGLKNRTMLHIIFN